MEIDLNEMNKEFRELQEKIEMARRKLFLAQDAVHKAKGDFYVALSDVARLEQQSIFAICEMAKLAEHI